MHARAAAREEDRTRYAEHQEHVRSALVHRWNHRDPGPGAAPGEPPVRSTHGDWQIRCDTPAGAHAMCEDYRAAASIDLEHDEADLHERIRCPLHVLWAEGGAMDRLYDVLLHQSYLNSTFGRFQDALEPAETMKESALVSGTPRCVAEADLAAAQALLLRSRAEEVVERLSPHRESFLGDWRHERFGQMGTRSIWYLGHFAQASARLGRFADAENALLSAREVAAEVQRPIDFCAVTYFAGIVDLLRGPTAAAIEDMKRQTGGGAFAIASRILSRVPDPWSTGATNTALRR